VLPAALALMAGCVTTGPLLGMHAMDAARRSLRAVIGISAITLSCALAGAVTGGTLGTMRFAAAGAWLGTLLFWWQLRQAVHESGTVPVPGWLWPRRSEEKPSQVRRG
jgi:hypothetical protein